MHPVTKLTRNAHLVGQPAGLRSKIAEAVWLHPGLMSPILLWKLMTGDTFGRMVDKGLDKSPCFGSLQGHDDESITAEITSMITDELLVAGTGGYPGLSVHADVGVRKVEIFRLRDGQ